VGILSRCSSNRVIVLAFIKMVIYITLIILSLVGAIYIVSIFPLRHELPRMALLATLIIAILYLWYKVTIVVIEKLYTK